MEEKAKAEENNQWSPFNAKFIQSAGGLEEMSISQPASFVKAKKSCTTCLLLYSRKERNK
jgi:hypothetical protein